MYRELSGNKKADILQKRIPARQAQGTMVVVLALGKLNVQLQLNFIAHDHISGFGYGIPGQANSFRLIAPLTSNPALV